MQRSGLERASKHAESSAGCSGRSNLPKRRRILFPGFVGAGPYKACPQLGGARRTMLIVCPCRRGAEDFTDVLNTIYVLDRNTIHHARGKSFFSSGFAAARTCPAPRGCGKGARREVLVGMI